MIIFLRKHRLVVFLAILVGLVYSLPQLLAPKIVPGFSGIYKGATDDMIYYEARAKDVLDGHPFLSNPYFYEHKDGEPMQFWIADYILAKTISFFNLSVPVGFILWTFFLVAVLFILSYFLSFILSSNKNWSIIFAIFFNICVSGYTFLRIPSPGFNFVFWLVLLLSILSFIHKENKKSLVISILSFGFLFHLYPYFWTFYAVLFAIYIFFGFIFKIENFCFKELLFIFFGALLIGSPYFFSMFQSMKLPEYSESIQRLGMITTHFPSGMNSVIPSILVIVIFIYFYFKKYININKVNTFLFSGLFAAIIVINQHVITGKNLEFSSHYYLGNIFWISICSFYLFNILLQRFSEKSKQIIFIVCILLISVFSYIRVSSVVNMEMSYSSQDLYVQRYAPVFKWLNENAKKDEVVFSNDSLNDYIPVYTSQNVYSSPLGILFFITNKEAEERFVINHCFDNFDREYILKNQRMIFGGYYINEFSHLNSTNSFRKILGLSLFENVYLPEDKISEVLNMSKDIKSKNFFDVLKKYRTDYIIWDSFINPNWKIKDNEFQEVYSKDGIYVYKVGNN